MAYLTSCEEIPKFKGNRLETRQFALGAKISMSMDVKGSTSSLCFLQ